MVANVTAVRPTSAGYLTAFPDDLCSIPTVSSLNFAANQTVPNMVISRLSPVSPCSQGAGYLAIYNDAGDTHVLIDVVGYFMA